jgi:hypothetical protein
MVGWTAMDPSKLTREERMKALSSLLFLKKKQTGKVKCREVVSPTVSMELTFVTTAIAAKERRHIR